MPRIEVDGVEDYKPDPQLNEKYRVRCTSADIHETTGSLMLKLQVTEGPDFADGSSPVDRIVFKFVNFDISKCNEDWQVKRVHKEVNEACTAFGVNVSNDGFETNDFVNAEAYVVVKPKKDKNDVTRDTITAMMPVED